MDGGRGRGIGGSVDRRVDGEDGRVEGWVGGVRGGRGWRLEGWKE